jgi:hypothetical protein
VRARCERTAVQRCRVTFDAKADFGSVIASAGPGGRFRALVSRFVSRIEAIGDVMAGLEARRWLARARRIGDLSRSRNRAFVSSVGPAPKSPVDTFRPSGYGRSVVFERLFRVVRTRVLSL